MVKVSEVGPFNGMLAAPKALVMVGGVTTTRFAVAVLPVPPLVEETLPVLFTKFPDAVPVIFTVRVQVLLAATVPPVSEILPEPATAVATPPQVLVSPLGVATTKPAGSVSVNATPVSATALAPGLVMVKVSDVVPFSGIAAAPKALAIEGGATSLMIISDDVPGLVAFDVLPVPPSVDVTCTLLCFTPAVVLVISTFTVHEALGASVPADKLTDVAPATAVVVPPQVLFAFGGLARIKPAGRLSVNAIPVRATVALGF